ncbi:MAG TPA: hypothetical protein DIW17_10980 [Clostridiales bacterium]|jgi:hypothetical protein|nr:hypothetical protein [Clostridiales bacterium]
MSADQLTIVLEIDSRKFQNGLNKAMATLQNVQRDFIKIAKNMAIGFQGEIEKSVSAMEEACTTYTQLGEKMTKALTLPSGSSDGGLEDKGAAIDTVQGKFASLSSSLNETGIALAGIGGLLGVLEPIGEQFNIEGLAGMGSTLIGMGETLALVSEGVSGLGTAFTILSGPVGLIIAAVAVLALAIYELWNNNEVFREGVLTAWASIQASIQLAITNITAFWQQWGPMIIGIITPIWEGIKTIISTAIQVIMGILSLLLNVMTGNWEGAKESVLGIVQALHDGVSGIVQSLVDFLGGLWILISEAASAAWNGIKDAALIAWDNLKKDTTTKLTELETFLTITWNRIITWATTKWTEFKDSFLNIWAAVVSGVKGYVNGIIGMINRLIDAFNSIQVEIPDWIPGPFAGQKFGINLPHVPQLAEGGIVTRATLALIGETGPEAVIPLNDIFTGYGGSVTFNISGPDPEEVVNLIQRKLLRVGVREL